MPHVPQQYSVPQGSKAPWSSGLPVTPDKPEDDKPHVPLTESRKQRSRFGLDRLSIRKYEKDPEDVARALGLRD